MANAGEVWFGHVMSLSLCFVAAAVLARAGESAPDIRHRVAPFARVYLQAIRAEITSVDDIAVHR
jgi:hypothetical protein